MYRKLNSVHLAQLGSQCFHLGLFQHGNVSHWLWIQNIASSVAADLIIPVIVIDLDSLHQLSHSSFAFEVTCVKALVVQIFLQIKGKGCIFCEQ